MSTEPTAAEVAEETTAWLVGGGVITLALFPFALPIVALTAIAALPLLVVPLTAGLLFAAVAGARAVIRRITRFVWRSDGRRPSLHPASYAPHA
jgi:hypothetical protein